MTTPPPDPRWHQPTSPPVLYPPPATPPAPQGQGPRILGMSLAVFGAVLGALVLFCCGGPIALLVFGGVLSGIDEATSAEPQVRVISCEIDNEGALPSADVQWEIHNPGGREENWTVTIVVLDAQGRQVGNTFDGAFGIDAGATVVSDVTVFLDSATGETCDISVDS